MGDLQQGCRIKSLKDVERIFGLYPKNIDDFKIILSIGYDSKENFPLSTGEEHVKVPTLVGGKICNIDEHCVNLVTLFNEFGLKTNYCCQGGGENDYYILFSESVTDSDIDKLVLAFYEEYGIVQHYGNFSKWKRCFGGKVVTNWRYNAKTIERAYADYMMFSKLNKPEAL